MSGEIAFQQSVFTMRPEVLQEELFRILDRVQQRQNFRENMCVAHILPPLASVSYTDYTQGSPYPASVTLTEDQLFLFWNLLGEELGIDLAVATESQRQLLLESCTSGKDIFPKDFGALLWLIFYSDIVYQ